MISTNPEIAPDVAVFGSRAPGLLLVSPDGSRCQFANGEYHTANPADIAFLLSVVRDSARIQTIWTRHLPDVSPEAPTPVEALEVPTWGTTTSAEEASAAPPVEGDAVPVSPPVSAAPAEPTPSPPADQAAAVRQARFEQVATTSALTAWNSRVARTRQQWQQEDAACQANIARALAELDRPMAALVGARVRWHEELKVLEATHRELAAQAAKHGIAVPPLTLPLPDGA